MKLETIAKLKELCDANKIEFVDTGTDLAVNYTLTDEELLQFVELEYGQTQQSVLQLFQCICKKAVKLAVEHSKDLK